MVLYLLIWTSSCIPSHYSHYLFIEPFFIETKGGGRVMVYHGYKFNRHRRTGPKTRWFCNKHHHLGCRAALYTIDDIIVRVNDKHNHRCTRIWVFPFERLQHLFHRHLYIKYQRHSTMWVNVYLSAQKIGTQSGSEVGTAPKNLLYTYVYGRGMCRHFCIYFFTLFVTILNHN